MKKLLDPELFWRNLHWCKYLLHVTCLISGEFHLYLAIFQNTLSLVCNHGLQDHWNCVWYAGWKRLLKSSNVWKSHLGSEKFYRNFAEFEIIFADDFYSKIQINWIVYLLFVPLYLDVHQFRNPFWFHRRPNYFSNFYPIPKVFPWYHPEHLAILGLFLKYLRIVNPKHPIHLTAV